MLKKLVLCCMAITLTAAVAQAAPPEASATFKVSQPSAVPGSTLAPGTYTIRVVDHLSDRYILQVDGGGASRPAFLGVPNPALKGAVGEIKWSKTSDGTTFLKGWNFKDAGPLEFVYPKDDAVALAKANGTQVAAIDPASEGRVSNNGLSKEDMQMVTLWLLSPTQVGSGDPGIKAQRYQQVASMPHKPVVAQLPHTASYLPAGIALGMLLLTLAAGLRLGARLIVYP